MTCKKPVKSRKNVDTIFAVNMIALCNAQLKWFFLLHNNESYEKPAYYLVNSRTSISSLIMHKKIEIVAWTRRIGDNN